METVNPLCVNCGNNNGTECNITRNSRNNEKLKLDELLEMRICGVRIEP